MSFFIVSSRGHPWGCVPLNKNGKNIKTSKKNIKPETIQICIRNPLRPKEASINGHPKSHAVSFILLNKNLGALVET